MNFTLQEKEWRLAREYEIKFFTLLSLTHTAKVSRQVEPNSRDLGLSKRGLSFEPFL